MIFRLRSICGVFMLMLIAPSVHSAPVQVLNDDFDAPNYSSFSFNESFDNPDDISFEFFAGVMGGGNPGDYLQVFHTHDIERISPMGTMTNTSVQSVLLEKTFTYDTNGAGSLGSLSFSLDVRTTDPVNFLSFAIGDSVNNSGSFTGFIGVPNDGEWHTLTFDETDGAQFNGQILQFGFGFGTSVDVGPDPIDYVIEVDNFVVIANAIPEPSSVAVLGLFLAGFVSRHRRSRVVGGVSNPAGC